MSREKQRQAALEYMKALANAPKPKSAPACPEFWEYARSVVIPAIKDSALSELRRKNSWSPKIFGFAAKDNKPMPFDLTRIYPDWGDELSKALTAKVMFTGAMIEGIKCNAFAVETWVLDSDHVPVEELEKIQSKGISDHPERTEAVLINAVWFDRQAYALQQLLIMFPIIKVLGADPSPEAWRHTEFGEPKITDPLGPEQKSKGRFIHGDEDEA